MTRLPRAYALLAAIPLLVAIPFADAAEQGKQAAPPASTAPALRLNVFFPADFTDAAFQKAAFEKVLAAWKPKGPSPAAGKKAVVVATIGKDGKLVGLEFNLKTGSEAFDGAALDAVKKAAPFKPLPKGYPQSSLEVHWHFEVGG